MKRFITLLVLLGLFFSSCDSPVSDLSSDPQSSSDAVDIISQIPPGAPRAKADSIRKAIWKQFKKQHGSEWNIRWSKDTDLPVSIFSGQTKETYSGNAQQAARTFMTRYGALLGISDMEQLQHTKTRTHRDIRHVTFQQTVQGIPVHEAEYKVHLQPDGRVDMVNGTYYPEIEISTSPSIAEREAISTARSDMNIPQETKLETTSELIIYPDEEQFHLAWKLTLSSEKPVAGWFYIVDAHSGEVLYKLNQLTNITGVGDVYPTHPDLSSPSNSLLYRLTGNDRLQGTYAYIVNDEGPEASSSIHSFNYNPDNTHFDEANLYYHIDNFRHNFIENIDDGSLGFTQIRAHAHTPIQDIDGDGDLDPNAWFNRNNQNLYFNDAYAPLGTRDFAKEDKVIHHEYGHAVIYDIESGIRGEDNEEGAISEGVPDYWAGSFTGRTVIGDYALPPLAQRNMANPGIASYNEYQNDPRFPNVPEHDGGEFFSAILWDLQTRMSAADVDVLVYDALYRVTGGPDFLEFRDAMMAADDAAFGGNHNNLIQNTFAAWGVGDFTPLDVSISGPALLDPGEQGTWNASVSDGSGPYSYGWYRTEGHVGSGSSYTGMGSGEQDFNLRVVVTDSDSRSGTARTRVIVGGIDHH